MIESINNEKVKFWTKLNDKKYQKQYNLFLVEGVHLVEEALKKGLLEEIIILPDFNFNFNKKNIVSTNVMKKITNLTNIPQIIGVVKKIIPKEIFGNVLLLDKISNPGNLGTIIRSSVAFGIDTIVIGKDSVDLYNPKVIRATEGLLFQINIIEEDLKGIIPKLKELNYIIYSTNVEKGTELKNITFTKKSAIIMGNEGAGVSKDLDCFVDETIYIKMKETCESLNVGIATSIILYELYTK